MGGAHPGGFPQPLQNFSTPDPDVAKNTISVEVFNEHRAPLSGALVELHSHFQSVAKGDEKDTLQRRSDPQGRVSFSDLKNTVRYSYSVSVLRDGARYEVPSFRLDKTGHRIVLHTYPATSDIKAASIGLRGFVYMSLRADVLSFEVMYRVMNMGQVTWIPRGVTVDLPEGAQAIQAGTKAGDSGFSAGEGSAVLSGSFPPGQKDLSFSFQLPNTNKESLSLDFGVLPHVAELRVLAEEIKGMQLSVGPGFERVDRAAGPEEKPVLITRRVMQPGEPELRQIQVELSGLPVIGPGRYIALGVASLILLLGLGALFREGGRDEKVLRKEQARARKALLREMLLLTQAEKDGTIGPRTFEQTKREILLALARLESDASSREQTQA